MILGPIRIVKEEYCVRADIEITHSDGKIQTLWYKFDIDFAKYITDEVHDGFLVGALLLAMEKGEDIYIRGGISEKLFYNLTSYYMDIVKIIIPKLKKIKIIPEYLVDNKEIGTEGAVLTGFSAGVDSFCTLYDHSRDNIPDSYSITHLLFNNVGSNGEWDPKDAERTFQSRYNLIKGFSEESGLRIIKVNSNLSEILKMDFQQTHTPRNISVVLLLQKLFAKFYYASAYSYKDIAVQESDSMAKSDPCTVHLLSTELTECIASGSQYTRTEKTRRVSNMEISRNWLNVCVQPTSEGKNCSSCWKCNRTLITLEIIGELENYYKVFNLDNWRKSRVWYIPEVVLNKKNKEPLTEEIRELLREKDHTFPARLKFWGFLISSLPTRVYLPLKQFYQRAR